MPEGKIIKALSGFYYVQHEEGVTQCRGRGVFRKIKNYTTCRRPSCFSGR